jgi:hypothetical protein
MLALVVKGPCRTAESAPWPWPSFFESFELFVAITDVFWLALL